MIITSINIILYILAFAVGVANICLSVIFHIRKNYSWTKYYIVFQSSITGVLVIFALRLYANILLTGQHEILDAFFILLLFANLAFLVAFIPYFTTWIIAHPWRNPYRAVFYTLSVLFFGLTILSLFIGLQLWIRIVLVLIFFGDFLFSIGVLLRHLSTIQDKDARTISKSVIIVSAVMIPMMVLDSFKLFIGVETFPVYYIWLSLIILIYLMNYFLHIPERPTGRINPDKITDLHITKREAEIIGLIYKGLTNKEIAERLFISAYTVNNHIANIYAKSDVRSRIDLINLFSS